MDKPEILTATEASRSFSELLHRVCYGGESFVIKKGNRLMARIVPVENASQPSSSESQSGSRACPALVAGAIQPPDPPGVLQEQNSGNDEELSDDAEFYHAWMEQVRKVEA